MTRWIDRGDGRGRSRGVLAVGRAWVGVLLRPGAFFRSAVAPGDQVPGLTFAVAAATPAVLVRVATEEVPAAFPGLPVVSGLFAAAVALAFVVPLGLHLAAATETVALLAVAPDRSTVSETVQVVGYATAPCVFAGLPVAPLRVACAVYGTVLLAVGTSVVHQVGPVRAILAAAAPATLVFGVGYGGLEAATALAEVYLSGR